MSGYDCFIVKGAELFCCGKQLQYLSDNRWRKKGMNTVHCEEAWQIPIPKGPPSSYHSCLATTKSMSRLDENPPSQQGPPESTQTGLTVLLVLLFKVIDVWV